MAILDYFMYESARYLLNTNHFRLIKYRVLRSALLCTHTAFVTDIFLKRRESESACMQYNITRTLIHRQQTAIIGVMVKDPYDQ